MTTFVQLSSTIFLAAGCAMSISPTIVFPSFGNLNPCQAHIRNSMKSCRGRNAAYTLAAVILEGFCLRLVRSSIKYDVKAGTDVDRSG